MSSRKINSHCFGSKTWKGAYSRKWWEQWFRLDEEYGVHPLLLPDIEPVYQWLPLEYRLPVRKVFNSSWWIYMLCALDHTSSTYQTEYPLRISVRTEERFSAVRHTVVVETNLLHVRNHSRIDLGTHLLTYDEDRNARFIWTKPVAMYLRITIDSKRRFREQIRRWQSCHVSRFSLPNHAQIARSHSSRRRLLLSSFKLFSCTELMM